MVILGIDPGTASTGYGVIKKVKGQKTKSRDYFKCLGYGLIKTNPSLTTSERLKKLNNELKGLIKKYQPKILATESIYFFKNLKTAMTVSQAEGVILFTAAQKKIPVYEFAPLQVKSAITGYGWAEKKIVQRKIKNLLKLKETPKPDDAADALAIALTYFLKEDPSQKISKRIRRA
jgi:crossover junction endodeoxyribonuclease RuvC